MCVCVCGEGTTQKHFTLEKRKTCENSLVKLFVSENMWGFFRCQPEFVRIFLGLFVVTDLCNQMKSNHNKNSHQENPSAQIAPWSQQPVEDPALPSSCWGLEHEKAALGWEKAN